MGTSVWGAVVDALVDQARALPGYRDPADPDGEGTPVYDGAELLTTSEAPTRYLAIGLPVDIDEIVAGTSDQAFATFPASRSRDENGSVTCSAATTSGTGSQREARALTFAVLADVETLIRQLATPHLGVTGLLWAEAGALDVDQWATDAGVCTGATFTIRYRARI